MADLAPPLPSLPFFTPYPSRRTRTVHAVPAQLRLQPQLCDRLTRLPRRRHTHPREHQRGHTTLGHCIVIARGLRFVKVFCARPGAA